MIQGIEQLLQFPQVHPDDATARTNWIKSWAEMCGLIRPGGLRKNLSTFGFPTGDGPLARGRILVRRRLAPGALHSVILARGAASAGATILPGVTIGENADVAAGAIVSKDVPEKTVAGGTPANILKSI